MTLPEQMRTPQTLAQKLCEVMLEVEGLHKDGTNEFHRYKFASAENVFGALRGPLASRGVLLLPAITAVRERDFKTLRGKDSTLTTIDLLMTFRDAATGEEIICSWAGAGDDPADKGLYKAMTGGVRTYLRDTFLLPQGDDPELDRRTDERAAGRQEARAAPPPELTKEQTDRMLTRLSEAGIMGAELETFLSAAGIVIQSPFRVTASQAGAVARLLAARTAAA
jgi:hypothetical protein